MSSSARAQETVASDHPRGGDRLRTEARARCVVCGSPGIPLYDGLRDHLFGVPGEWNITRCSDEGCALLWLNPMPIEEDIAKAYTRYFTHKDAAESHSSLARRLYRFVSEGYLAAKFGYGRGSIGRSQRALGLLMYLHPPQRSNLDFSVMYLRASPGGRLLEVGCGAGRNLARLQELGWQCEGVDFDGSAVRNARVKGLKVHEGTLDGQRFPGESFDAVVSSHVIEHLHDPRGFLLECRRVLKPGGTLVVVTPNSASLGHSLFRASWRPLEPPRHLHLFNHDSLMRLVRDAAFLEADIKTTIHGANWVFAASEIIAEKSSAKTWKVPGALTAPWALGMQILEWAVLKADRRRGEELLLSAKK